jgi:predicted cupin superfamily sugar epimerase
MTNAADLIARLRLTPHPEGGWFREVHRAVDRVETQRGARSALTTIYYLLEKGQISRWHVVSSDEIWHFYAGAPLQLLIYDPASRSFRAQVLASPAADCEPLGVVRAGEWQAARSLGEHAGDYSLVGCNVGPGFEFDDFRFVATLPGHEAHFTGEAASALAGYSHLL